MNISDILSADMILPDLKSRTKAELLREMAARLAAVHPEMAVDELVEVLEERERLGSTAIGDGIAIPHGKLRGVREILGAFGRHRQGIDFQSLDGNPTHLFFLLVAPEDSTNLHLKALARVSRLLKDDAFRRRLLEAEDAAQIFHLITQEDAKY